MNMIVLFDMDGCIAVNGDQVLHLSNDLQNFKNLTYKKTVVYGRKTLEALPNQCPLKSRNNFILSNTLKDESFIDYSEGNVHILRDIDQIIQLPKYIKTNDIFIIGGASLYEVLLPWVSNVYVTQVIKVSFKDIYLKYFCINSEKMDLKYFPIETLYREFYPVDSKFQIDIDKNTNYSIQTQVYKFSRL